MSGNVRVFVVGDTASVSKTAIRCQVSRNRRFKGPIRRADDRDELWDGKSSIRSDIFNQGNMAVVGKNFAVLERGPIRTSGFLTWLVWESIAHHLATAASEPLAGPKSVGSWCYFTGQRGSRLIPEPPRTPNAETR